MGMFGRWHESEVKSRRARVLARHFDELLPRGARVLDVGCGDGRMAEAISSRRPDVVVEGVDVLVPPSARIPVRRFDGETLPVADEAFDAVILCDVLHHAESPTRLLAEAIRVAPGRVLIKDNLLQGALSKATLRFMDWAGNARHGVALRDDYWSEGRWRIAFRELGVEIAEWRGELGLYPWPAKLLFERRLHFVARLRRARPTAAVSGGEG